MSSTTAKTRKDLHLDLVHTTRLSGNLSTIGPQDVEKVLPPSLSEQDDKVLTLVKRRADCLDCGLFTFLGIKFGWGSAIGLLPLGGDVVDCLLALTVINTANQIEGGLPFLLQCHMLWNVAVDFAVGLAPCVGDLADAMFKANLRNSVLLEAHLRQKHGQNLRRGKIPIPDVGPLDLEGFNLKQDRSVQFDRCGVPSAHCAASMQNIGATGSSRTGVKPVTVPEDSADC